MGTELTPTGFYIPDYGERYDSKKDADWQALNDYLQYLSLDGTHGDSAHSEDYAKEAQLTEDTQAFSAAASGGPVPLAGNESVVIDTGVTAGAGHYFGTADVPADMDYAVSTHRDDSGTGTWKIHVEQNTTAITAGDIDWVLWGGNP